MSAGGAATLASGAMSLLALKSTPKDQLEAECLAALQAHLEASSLTKEIEQQIVLMLDGFLPEREDFAAGDMNAPEVARLMRYRVEASGFAGYDDPPVLEAYEALLVATLTPLLKPRTQSEANQARLLTGQSEQTDMQKQMLAILQSQQAYTTLLQAGVSEEAILGQIRRVSENTKDLNRGMDNLASALDRLAAFEAEARRGGNFSGPVERALEEAGILVNEDRAGEARTRLAQARAQAAAEMSKLLSKEIDVAMIDGDAQGAAALIVERADQEAGGQAGFEALRALREAYYVEGRDQGLALPLLISIEIARLVLDRAVTADDRGAALNDLGIALATLGARESGTARLEEAVMVYRAALKEWTRARVPQIWAGIQNNLGNALRTLGERESGTARLEEALAAFHAALEEWTREREPLDWAGAQANLGSALSALGARESVSARLEEAVTAFHAALTEYTRERAPLDWAKTQNNLGTALTALAEREGGSTRLEEAVTAFRAALKEETRERVPFGWAELQNNLGVALSILGERERGTARFEEAMTAYRAALEERTRERVPLDWAITQMNLGGVELAFFDKTGERAHLERAKAHLEAAREIFAEAGATRYLAMVEGQLAEIAAREG